MNAGVSAVIPTYGRDQVLLDTIDALAALESPPAEILVLDQTPVHEPSVEARLRELDGVGAIRWLRLPRPSIPCAMNAGLLAAKHGIVLFLDDDIVPDPGLVARHEAAHAQYRDALVAGRVVQPWDAGCDFVNGPHSEFSGLQERWIEEFMGGNFSVRREDALALGGFDENFVRVAYRFEAEFAHRFRASGRRIRFYPGASLLHLKAGSGGTRSFGEHLTTWKPHHAVGAYYHALRTMRPGRALGFFLSRPLRAVATRHHATRPWWVPVTLLAELLAMAWAARLGLRGPRYAGMSPDR